MVSNIGQQSYSQTYFFILWIFKQTPGQAGAVSAMLHPDARLDQQIIQTIAPDRHSSIQPERFNQKRFVGLYRAVDHAVGVQADHLITIQQFGISPGKKKMPLKIGLWCGYQQAMVTSGQCAGYRCTGIASFAIGQPPFVLF